MNKILAETQQRFAVWQAQGNHRYNDRSLKEQAVQCLEYHTYKQVSEAIGVTIKTLKSWQTTPIKTIQETTSCEPDFIPLVLSRVQKESQAGSSFSSLQLILPSGITIKLKQQDISTFVDFICHLNKALQQCSI